MCQRRSPLKAREPGGVPLRTAGGPPFGAAFMELSRHSPRVFVDGAQGQGPLHEAIRHHLLEGRQAVDVFEVQGLRVTRDHVRGSAAREIEGGVVVGPV